MWVGCKRGPLKGKVKVLKGKKHPMLQLNMLSEESTVL